MHSRQTAGTERRLHREPIRRCCAARAAAALFSILACADAGDKSSFETADHRGLPALVAVHVPALDSLGPESVNASLAVSSNGALAYTDAFHGDERYALTLMDSLGNRVPVGRRGQGPFEFSGPAPFIFFDSISNLIAIDLGRNHADYFDTGGKPLRSLGPMLRPGEMPLAIASDSIDIAILEMEEGLSLSSVKRLSLRSLQFRTVLQRSDSAVRMLQYPRPLIVSNGRRIVMANPRSGVFVVVDSRDGAWQSWNQALQPRLLTEGEIDALLVLQKKIGKDGMLLPRWAGERERLRKLPQDHFKALALDGASRLWAFGIDTSGVAFADVFAASTNLGRITIPCRMARYEARLFNNWLAMLCTAAESDAGVVLRLFRIDG